MPKMSYKEMVAKLKELAQERKYLEDFVHTKLDHIDKALTKQDEANNHRRAMEKLETAAGKHEHEANEIEGDIAQCRGKIDRLLEELEQGAEDA